MKQIYCLLLMLFTFDVLAAGAVNDFKVKEVRVDKSGYGYVKFDRLLEGTPASCISGHEYHLSFDLNTPGGKGIMSLALSAQATGKSVKAGGTGTCDSYSIVEAWSWGVIRN